MSKLSKAAFHSEAQAFEYLEKTLWPDGPICPHCGSLGTSTRLEGKASRIGTWQCNEKECRKQFTVKVGTVFEHGRIPLHKMLQAVYLLCCSKKGCSSHQLHRILGITYKSAWFLSHRIREAMRTGSLAPMGGPGGIVEVDETYIGRQQGMAVDRSGYHNKNMVVTLVERGGSARSFHTDGHSAASIYPIVLQNIRRESRLMTDKAMHYRAIGDLFADHGTVAHERDEYVRGGIHTNTVEGFYSIFKRGMKGVYQHCSEKHLHRYLAEFDFRYSHRVARGVNDEARANRAMKGIVGKRLTYRNPHVTAAE
jgi:transposase-like protein